MGLLTPTRRVYHRWRNVLPLYDGRECPDCGAVICGREARRVHREWHMQTGQWQEWVTNAIMQLARHGGIPTIEPAEHRQDPVQPGGDGYGRVDLRTQADDGEEDDDDE